MSEEFDLGKFLKKAFIVALGIGLIGIGLIAALTLVGVVIAIPLFKKGARALLLHQSGNKSGKIKWEDEEGSHKYKW